MRLVIFEGTVEEFEAVRPLTEPANASATVGADDQPENPAATRSGSKRPPTYEEAVKILRLHGGIPQRQEDLVRVLYDQEEPVDSSTLRDANGWTKPQFRGIRANFPRRAKGALGRDDVEWVRRRWNADKGENEYWLPDRVRQALKDELGW